MLRAPERDQTSSPRRNPDRKKGCVMYTKLNRLFDVYTMPTRRRLHALHEVELIAAELGEKKLTRLLDRALEHDTHTLALENRWSRSGTNDIAAYLKKIDRKIDRTLAAIRDVAAAQASVSDPGEAQYDRSIELLSALFPAGLHAVTTMSYAEELVEVEAILAKLNGELKTHVKVLAIEELVQKLGALAIDYREAQRAPREEMEFETLRAARDRGQDYLLRVIAVIVGTYFDDTEEHQRARTDLLAPILAQNDAVGLAYRLKTPIDIESISSDAPPAPAGE
jgi:hypothetical protein